MRNDHLLTNNPVAAGTKSTRQYQEAGNRVPNAVELPPKYVKMLRKKYPLNSTQKSRLADLLHALENAPHDSETADRALSELLDSALFLAVAGNFEEFCEQFLGWSVVETKRFAARPTNTFISATELGEDNDTVSAETGDADVAPTEDRGPAEQVEEAPAANVDAGPDDLDGDDEPVCFPPPTTLAAKQAGIAKPLRCVLQKPDVDKTPKGPYDDSSTIKRINNEAATPSKDMAHEIGDRQKRSQVKANRIHWWSH